jgi:hypothetical protein
MLQRGPSLQPFVHRAAFCWFDRLCADLASKLNLRRWSIFIKTWLFYLPQSVTIQMDKPPSKYPKNYTFAKVHLGEFSSNVGCMRHFTTIKFPNFYVFGAAKAGTTAVWHWLRQHEDVFLPDVKEPGYFAFANTDAKPKKGPFDADYASRITTDAEAFNRLYLAAGSRMTGDASPVYLSHQCAAQSIACVRPDAMIIIILRNPVERAFSQYLHHVRDGLEPCNSFEAALAAEPDRLAEGWSWSYGYAALGDYADQISRVLNAFPQDQVLFLEYSALQTDPATCWERICDHLGVKRQQVVLNERVNATSTLLSVPGRPAISRRLTHPGPIQSALKKVMSPRVRTIIRRCLEGSGQDVPKLTVSVRASLTNRYSPEVPRIEALTGLSVTHWFS